MKKTYKSILLILSALCACVFLLTSCNINNENPITNNEPNASTNGEATKPITTNPVETDPKDSEHTHTFGDWETTLEATCSEKGAEQRLCSCGEKETRSIDMLDHIEIIDNAVPPSCSKTGLTEGKHCDVCNEILVAQTTLEKSDHSYGEWIVDKEATKAENGKQHRSCTVCGESENEILYATGSVGLKYNVNYDNDTTCTVMGLGTCNDTTVYVPAYIDGYKVTTVQGLSFSDNITVIHLAEGIQTIGNYAFASCDNLTTVTIPTSVININKGAFDGCENLSAVDIPESVITIGDQAFSECFKLKNIYLSKNVQLIGTGAFSYCTALESINVDEENLNYKSIDGNLYTKNGDTLLQYAIGKKASSFVIPDGVVEIDKWACLSAKKLTSVTIPASVRTIELQAFAWCDSLKSITIPEGVETIEQNAFEKCYKVTSITLPSTLTTLGESAFYWCENLSSIVIPQNLTNIEPKAFNGCSKLKNITIPEGVTFIGDYAFCNSSAVEINIPSSVTYIGYQALSSSNLTKISVSEDNTEYKSIDGALYTKDGSTLIMYPQKKTNTSFKIIDTVTYISKNCFAYNSWLTSITISKNVSTIDERAFHWVQNLTEINFEGTKAEWEAINKDTSWDYYASENGYTVKCTDGDIFNKVNTKY